MTSEEAFELEARVVAARAVERRTWVTLAEWLTVFHQAEAWKQLGWDTFTAWIATPEVSLGRRQAYRLIQAWRWAGESGVSPETLELMDLTKLAVVIPALKAGRVELSEALDDVMLLSRSDLVEKYTEGLSVSRVMSQGTFCDQLRDAAVQVMAWARATGVDVDHHAEFAQLHAALEQETVA